MRGRPIPTALLAGCRWTSGSLSADIFECVRPRNSPVHSHGHGVPAGRSRALRMRIRSNGNKHTDYVDTDPEEHERICHASGSATQADLPCRRLSTVSPSPKQQAGDRQSHELGSASPTTKQVLQKPGHDCAVGAERARREAADRFRGSKEAEQGT
jgi:hypothetical protein